MVKTNLYRVFLYGKQAAIFKMDNRQGPATYSTWNSVQCYVAVWMGGKFGGEWIHVYKKLKKYEMNP